MSGSRLSSWSDIRRKLEQDYLCPALRGRIQYFAATYRQSHDREGRVGKRRLMALGEEMARRPAWLQAFYGLRLQAEGLAEAPKPGEGPAGQPLPPPGPQIAGPDTERKL